MDATTTPTTSLMTQQTIVIAKGVRTTRLTATTPVTCAKNLARTKSVPMAFTRKGRLTRVSGAITVGTTMALVFVRGAVAASTKNASMKNILLMQTGIAKVVGTTYAPMKNVLMESTKKGGRVNVWNVFTHHTTHMTTTRMSRTMTTSSIVLTTTRVEVGAQFPPRVRQSQRDMKTLFGKRFPSRKGFCRKSLVFA